MLEFISLWLYKALTAKPGESDSTHHRRKTRTGVWGNAGIMNDIVLVGFTSVMLLVTENPSPANTHIAYDNILYI